MARNSIGRPRTGSLYLARSGWRARVTVEVDGVNVQRSFDLETKSKAAARVKLRRLLSSPIAQVRDDARRLESFEEAARRIVGDSAISTAPQRLSRLERFAYPSIGNKSVAEVTAADVRGILAEVVSKGLSRQVCVHTRNDISAVLGELWREEILPENVVSKVRIPAAAKVDNRERAVLTDEELARYLAWMHPDPRWQRSLLERQTMACVARMLNETALGAVAWDSGVRQRHF